MQFLKVNLVLALLSFQSLQANADEIPRNWFELAESLGLDVSLEIDPPGGEVRRRMTNSTSPKGALPKEAFPKEAGRDSLEPRRLQNGLKHYTTVDDFTSNGGESAMGPMGICEGFDDTERLDQVGPAVFIKKCSDNPLSASSLGGCLTYMQPGISIGASGPLAIVSAAVTSALDWTPAAPGVVPIWSYDQAYIQFDPPVKAVSFYTGDGFQQQSIPLTVEDSKGDELGVVESGTQLSFVGLVSTGEPIKTIKYAKTAGPNNDHLMELIDHICFPEDKSGGDDVSGEVGGDPHFQTFSGSWYEYMGACDLKLLHAPNFTLDMELDINIRTKIRYGYSYIEEAVLSIGEETLHVSSFGNYAIDGVSHADLSVGISGFPIVYSHPNDKVHSFEIMLGEGEKIVLKTFKDMVAVNVDHLHADRFHGSVGMMGAFDKHGAMLGRDGTTIISDPNNFAAEWQVREDESMLFPTAKEPQYPQACVLPAASTKESRLRRRLGETATRKEAEKACANWPEDRVDMCVQDVMATGDLDLALAGAF